MKAAGYHGTASHCRPLTDLVTEGEQARLYLSYALEWLEMAAPGDRDYEMKLRIHVGVTKRCSTRMAWGHTRLKRMCSVHRRFAGNRSENRQGSSGRLTAKWA